MVRIPYCRARLTRTKTIKRTTIQLVLLVCILTTVPLASACRSDGIQVRSWEEAISYAQIELEAAGDVEGRLENYDRTAARLGEEIELLDQVRPALQVIERLRDVHVPLVGDGWQILLALLSVATVDGAKILAKLEEILSKLAQLKVDLDNLRGLPEVSDAIRAFRSAPNPRALSAVASTSAAAMPSLRQLHADLGEVLDPIQDTASNLSGLVKGLGSAADVGIPVISDAAQYAAERIGLIEEPLLALRDGLVELHQNIETDAQLLENIQEAVRQAREHEQ